MTLQCDRIVLVETLQGCKRELFEEPGTSLNQEQMPVVTILIETNKTKLCVYFIIILYNIFTFQAQSQHANRAKKQCLFVNFYMFSLL